MSDTPARLLKLLSLLQTPREWPGGELATRLEVSPRTIRRDIERLRGLGYPVQATMGAVGGYRLVAGATMPPLLLDDEEAVAIAIGLTAAGHVVEGIDDASVRALAKLEQVLPARLRRRVSSLSTAIVPWLSGGEPAVEPLILATLAAAIANHERLRFDYQTADGTASKRMVEPHRLVASIRRWYLVAYDNDRDDWRVFRVDRVQNPQPTGLRSAARILPAPDAAAFVAERIANLTPMYRAVATLHAPVAEVETRAGRRIDGLEPIDDRSSRLRTETETLESLAYRLTLLGVEFTLHEPPELIAFLRAMAERIGRATDHPA